MKIGIATFHAVHNNGSVLQSLALQDVLKEAGHESYLINLLPEYLENSNRKVIPIRSFKSLLVNLALLPFRSKLKKRYGRFEKFRSERLVTTRQYSTLEELAEDPPGVDFYLVGSDQVWNLEQGGNPIFFLRFLQDPRVREKTPVIAYAPSFGAASIPKQYEERFVDWAKVFDFLSVREASGKILAERLLEKPVLQVLDPVFLKRADYWKEIAGPRLRKKPYIAFYSLEASGLVSDCLLRIARHLKLPVVVLGKPGTFMVRCRSIVAIDAGPREFLSWIAHADFVVTNSFHATAFSALFRRPFATVAHSTRNARMESLLDLLGEKERIISSVNDLNEDRWHSLVDLPEEIEPNGSGRFAQELKKSLDFLKQSVAAIEAKRGNPADD